MAGDAYEAIPPRSLRCSICQGRPMGEAKIYSITILLLTRAQPCLVCPTPEYSLPHPCPSEVGLKELEIHKQCVAISG